MSPANITINTSLVSWAPPPDRNGIIISYTVRYVAVSMANGTQQGRTRRQAGGEVLSECVMGGEENIDRSQDVPGNTTQLLLEELS